MLAKTYHDTWLIIPVFNEAQVIQDVIAQALKTFPNIVCVDDGSVDLSGPLAQKTGAWLVTHPINLGQGASIQTGIDFALSQEGSQFFVTFDADGQHSASDAANMVARLKNEDLDIIIGSRFRGGKTNFSVLKKMVLKIAVKFERIRTGLEITDAHNGLRAMNRNTAREMKITQNRMAHASEITSRISSLHLKYAEHPVTISYTAYSKNKGQSIWNSVNIISELWIK